MSNLKMPDLESFEELDDADLAAVIGGHLVKDADIAVDNTVTNTISTVQLSIDGIQAAGTLLTSPTINLARGAF
jgi:bacteriocin-like protein